MTINTFWKYILDNPDKKWDYSALSKNPNITWDIVKANPDQPWDYLYLSLNSNITWEIVKANPDKPWDYELLSSNKMNRFTFPLCVMKRRAKERSALIKEELVAKAWHPSRVEKWLEAGMDIDDC